MVPAGAIIHGINATGAVPVPLTVYGSLVTEVAPNAVPENISPDCGDVAFAPGSVGRGLLSSGVWPSFRRWGAE